ncbi:hypothetical protein L6164_037796 [Bauhinia variegata]|uniref:Uncharacterized protein n=1 Tax=Bauhinia variegata TaxID=167791 RepID=A0ACB9KLW9_BAUVA|nr:hypothetical protein L6164_037796 [Bauhinia variegata]
MLRFPPVRSRVGLGEHPSDCLRGSKRAHKAHNKNKTNRDFIRDHLSCRSICISSPYGSLAGSVFKDLGEGISSQDREDRLKERNDCASQSYCRIRAQYAVGAIFSGWFMIKNSSRWDKSLHKTPSSPSLLARGLEPKKSLRLGPRCEPFSLGIRAELFVERGFPGVPRSTKKEIGLLALTSPGKTRRGLTHNE